MKLAFRIEQRLRRLLRIPAKDVAGFGLESSRRDELLSNASGDIERMIYGHKGRIIDKWTHYPAIYERHFASFRGKPVTMLEIGVYMGGSLELWRSYFGPDATIFGIDIDPQCASRVDPPNQVRIGSQGDPLFLASVIGEMGRPDIILDDGSHIAEHQAASFRALFPSLKNGGLYVIEDAHTSYWRDFQGGYRRAGTAVELAKRLIDDMHHWYHAKGGNPEIAGLHIYDSVIVIEKGRKDSPRWIRVG